MIKGENIKLDFGKKPLKEEQMIKILKENNFTYGLYRSNDELNTCFFILNYLKNEKIQKQLLILIAIFWQIKRKLSFP